MDRCRCDEYEEAVNKIKFYTVGTLRPDIIDNYDRSEYLTAWVKNRISLVDRRFKKPRAWKKQPPETKDPVLERRRQRDQMGCPYMTPVKYETFELTNAMPDCKPGE